MPRLITRSQDPMNTDDKTEYRYIDYDWEVMACYLDDLPMYPSVEAAEAAYRMEHEGVSP